MVGETFVTSPSCLHSTSEGFGKLNQSKAADLEKVNLFAVRHKLSVAA